MITLIAAVAENMAIGYQNKLLYWLPNDLKRFKALTTGHTIVMGRKTFESFPKGALPNRRNVVLSRSAQVNPTDHSCEQYPGAEVFHSLEEALASCSSDEDIYIIGGDSVYRQAMPLADRLCLTEIADTPAEADAYFPAFNKDEWTRINVEEHATDERHAYAYSFVDYKKLTK